MLQNSQKECVNLLHVFWTSHWDQKAISVGKYIGKLFEHPGFTVMGEWFILNEHHGSDVKSSKGKVGDVRGKPNGEGLRKIKEKIAMNLKNIR